MHKIALYLHVQLDQDSNAQILKTEIAQDQFYFNKQHRFFRNSNITSFLKTFIQISECRYR